MPLCADAHAKNIDREKLPLPWRRTVSCAPTKSISIGSTVSTRLTLVTNRDAYRPRRYMCNSWPHLALCVATRPSSTVITIVRLHCFVSVSCVNVSARQLSVSARSFFVLLCVCLFARFPLLQYPIQTALLPHFPSLVLR